MTRRRRRDAPEPARQLRPAQAARDGYRPAEGAPVLGCTCGAVFVDDPPSRRAHLVVFGHRPQVAKTAALALRDDREAQP